MTNPLPSSLWTMPRRGPPPPLPSLPEFYVRTTPELAETLDHLLTQPIIGYDTEFVGEETYRPDLGLIQLSTVERLIIIDPLSFENLDRFWQVLLDPNRVVVVHAGREDLRLCWYATGKPPARVVDVQIAAGLAGSSYPISYSGLVLEALKLKAEKGETLTDWRRRPLSANQLRYAFDDVRYLLPIWQKLRETLRRRNRLSWAEEEFTTAVDKAVGEEATVERWRKLKGLGGMSRKELAIVREVYAWRDRRAAQWNRPQRVVLRDELITELAKRPPRRLEDIHQLRGVARTEAEAIFQAVQRVLSLPPEHWPELPERDADSPQLSTLANLLNIVLTDWATQEQIAPNLIASLSDLKQLIRSRQSGQPMPSTLALGRGWRSEAVLPLLTRFLQGEVSIRISNLGSAKPLQFDPAQPSRERLE